MGGTEAMTSLDLTALSATDAEAPAVTKRSSKVADSPFPGWVRETYESGNAKAVTVRADQVGEVRYAIRAAAKIEALGSRIVLRDKDGKALDWFSGDGEAYVIRETPDGAKEVPSNTNVTVIFRGQEKRQRRTKDEIQAADASADESDTEDTDESGIAYEDE
jgi:hypothetical protein